MRLNSSKKFLESTTVQVLTITLCVFAIVALLLRLRLHQTMLSVVTMNLCCQCQLVLYLLMMRWECCFEQRLPDLLRRVSPKRVVFEQVDGCLINIPDEYTLTSRTDDRIDFTVTAHYSYPYPRWDETDDERDKRLETSYEYTRTYPVTLIYTDAGWRFDAFATPNQADMQLIGEWDGVEETDFYLPNN